MEEEGWDEKAQERTKKGKGRVGMEMGMVSGEEGKGNEQDNQLGEELEQSTIEKEKKCDSPRSYNRTCTMYFGGQLDLYRVVAL